MRIGFEGEEDDDDIIITIGSPDDARKEQEESEKCLFNLTCLKDLLSSEKYR